MGGSTTVEAPQPSKEEIALQQAQLDILNKQQSDTAKMEPYILSGMGLKLDANGNYVRMTEAEKYAAMTSLEKAQYDVAKQQQDRLKKAFAGELPVSPALEKSLSDEQRKMAEALSQRLGPNWMETTPGQQAMSTFQQRADLLREEARRGEMTSGQGLLMTNLGYLGNTQAQDVSQAAQFPTRTSGLFQGYGQAQQPYQYYSGMQYNANVQNAQNNAASQAGLLGGIGSLFGAGASAYGTYAGLAALAI